MLPSPQILIKEELFACCAFHLLFLCLSNIINEFSANSKPWNSWRQKQWKIKSNWQTWARSGKNSKHDLGERSHCLQRAGIALSCCCSVFSYLKRRSEQSPSVSAAIYFWAESDTSFVRWYFSAGTFLESSALETVLLLNITLPCFWNHIWWSNNNLWFTLKTFLSRVGQDTFVLQNGIERVLRICGGENFPSIRFPTFSIPVRASGPFHCI